MDCRAACAYTLKNSRQISGSRITPMSPRSGDFPSPSNATVVIKKIAGRSIRSERRQFYRDGGAFCGRACPAEIIEIRRDMAWRGRVTLIPMKLSSRA